jgi:thiazole synthase ThiGH ThiG subunit
MNKNVFTLALAAGALAAALALPRESGAQASDEAVMTAQLLKDIQAQEAKFVENQKAIDEKIASIAEEIRLARAFSARGK